MTRRPEEGGGEKHQNAGQGANRKVLRHPDVCEIDQNRRQSPEMIERKRMSRQNPSNGRETAAIGEFSEDISAEVEDFVGRPNPGNGRQDKSRKA